MATKVLSRRTTKAGPAPAALTAAPVTTKTAAAVTVDGKSDSKLSAAKVAMDVKQRVAVRVPMQYAAPPSDPDDPLDNISRQARIKDPNAVLFHRVYPCNPHDETSITTLMRATISRAAIASNGRNITNVRDYITYALGLQISIDHFCTGKNRTQTVFLSEHPVFKMGPHLCGYDVLTDIVYWLGDLGLTALHQALLEIGEQLQTVFGIHNSSLRPIVDYVNIDTSEDDRLVACFFFGLACREFLKRYGIEWEKNVRIVMDTRASTRDPTDLASAAKALMDPKSKLVDQAAARMHKLYISALFHLNSAAFTFLMWLKTVDTRRKGREHVRYSEVDISTLSRCSAETNRCVDALKELKNKHFDIGVNLFCDELAVTLAVMRNFTIASHLADKQNDLDAAWYAIHTPEGWFPSLRASLKQRVSDEDQKKLMKQVDPPKFSALMFPLDVHRDQESVWGKLPAMAQSWPKVQLQATARPALALPSTFSG